MSKKNSKPSAKSGSKVNKTPLIVSCVVLFICVLSVSTLNRLMFHPEGGLALSNPDSFLAYRSLRIVLILGILLSLSGILLWGVVRSSLSERIKGVSVMIFSFLFLLLVAEIFFSFYARTNGVDTAWSQVLWSNKYWKPLRMSLPDSTSVSLREDGSVFDVTKKKIYTIGDSFTGGDGLDNPDSSYTSVLRSSLEKNYPGKFTVANLGERGADSYKELNNLKVFTLAMAKSKSVQPLQLKPELIIWQYYGNDVDFTAKNMGIKPEFTETPLDKLLDWIFREHLFVTDYMYWHFFKRNEEKAYIEFLRRCYSAELIGMPNGVNATVKATHFEPIRSIYGSCNQDSVGFVMVIFPFMNNIPLSEELYANEIEKVCRQSKVHVINLCGVYKNYTTAELIVSNDNPHPSALAHRLAADTIFRYAVANNLLK